MTLDMFNLQSVMHGIEFDTSSKFVEYKELWLMLELFE